MGQSISSYDNSVASSNNRSFKANSELAQQFAGMMERKKENAKKEYKQAIDQSRRMARTEQTTVNRKLLKSKEKTELDEQPSMHQTIATIQKN